MKLPGLLLASLLLLLLFCSKVFPPYPCGPVLDKEGIQIFKRQNEFLGLKSGMTFADIGASSGYYDGAMAVFLDSVTFADIGASSGYYDGAMAVFLDGVTFYLNDINTHCLNDKNLKKVLKYYSELRGSSIETTNPFHYVIGTKTRTKLPENTFDVIFCNATAHVLDYPDSILRDVHKNLKPNGRFFIRDEFVYNGEAKKCSSKKCGHMLLKYEPFIHLMTRNGFILMDESRDFGYPIYKFAKG